MYVALKVLLILHVAWGQQNPPTSAPPGPPGPPPDPSAGPSPTAPGASQAPGASNPWQELLQRMMDLMQTSAPGGAGCPDCAVQKTDPAGNPQQPPVVQQPPQQPTQKAQTRPPPPPTKQTPEPVADCFWEGRFYRPGSDIVRGQHDRWCYVTYCDNFGKIQFWDDYNCPPNSMKPTSGHNEGRGAPGPPGGGAGGPPSGGGPHGGPRGGPRGGPSGGPRGGAGGPPGCDHKGAFYDPGQEITSHRVGERCYGTYCSHDSKVVNWEDWCTEPTTQTPKQPPRGGGGNRGGGGGGRGGGGGGGGRGGGGKRGGGNGGGRGGGGGRKGPGRGGGGGGGRGGGGGGAGAGGGGRRGGGGRGGAGKRANRLQGCYHNGMYYQPNEDVIVGNIGDLCYGYYCEGANTFVHWEDQCVGKAAAQPTPAAAPAPAAGGFFFK